MSDSQMGVAVVTGAAAGIGRAVAHALFAAGFDVAIADRDAEGVKRIQEMDVSGLHAIAVPADVSSEGDVVALADEAERALGPITAWVNVAGITRPAMLLKMAVEDFDAVMQVHARGTFLGMREAARRMTASGTIGSIVNVTSAAGLQGTIGQANYAAAKGAIVSLTKSGARELARYGIRVNAVAPVAATDMTETIRTDPKFAERFLAQIPLGRVAEPDEVAGAFVYLATSASSYVTGQVLCVDGGLYMTS